ncbi:hypothetical protein VTP01DRAFT_2245 [Rhizomucor pusillus]|uniref:uncharacterized protein n=1 Tax=Rhizomucor pusillus TaxID=4840 RepID=UPI00374239FD
MHSFYCKYSEGSEFKKRRLNGQKSEGYAQRSEAHLESRQASLAYSCTIQRWSLQPEELSRGQTYPERNREVLSTPTGQKAEAALIIAIAAFSLNVQSP